MNYSRRDFGKLTLSALPVPWLIGDAPLSALGKIDSRINGVQIGAITYSFRTIPDAAAIVNACVRSIL